MPVYIYECPACNEYFELYEPYITKKMPPETASCRLCGGLAERNYKAERAGLPPFTSYWTEAFKGKDPVNVTSREQEKKLCKEHGFERTK